MQPDQFPHRILLAVTGLSPQIVTETLYALVRQRQPAFVPTEIHVITTTEGAQRVRLTLLDSKEGHFHALCQDYGLSGIRFDESCVHVIGAEQGQPLSDIRSPEENAIAADSLLETVRQLTADADSALHVSIAGGRKTMGFYLGYCLSLLARPQDRLSHVLVSDPFESHPQFYYPPSEGRVLYTRDNRPVHTSDARITLAEIPFVRLRRGIPQAMLNGSARFAETVAATEQALPFPDLRIDLERKEIICAGKAVKLPPQLFAFYLWLAEARKQGRSWGGEPGFVRWTDPATDDFLAVYGRVVGKRSDAYEKARATFQAQHGFEKDFFSEKAAKINRKLDEQLGDIAAMPYRIVPHGPRLHTRHGLKLAPEVIVCGKPLPSGHSET